MAADTPITLNDGGVLAVKAISAGTAITDNDTITGTQQTDTTLTNPYAGLKSAASAGFANCNNYSNRSSLAPGCWHSVVLDLGTTLYHWNRVQSAVAAGEHFAFLAGLMPAKKNVPALLVSNSARARAWTCASPAFTCSDGFSPGLYIEIVGAYTIKPVLTNVTLTGATLRCDALLRIR